MAFKIPVYRADGQLSSTMPGRQIRARRSVQGEAQAELAKAAPGLALTEQVSEYATTRYKMQVENQVNDAMLDAEVALRERRKELEKSQNYSSVLDDGDNSIWNKETAQLQRDLQKKVGKNRYALQQFDNRFRQLEIRNRFALRDAIDRRTVTDAARNRARTLQSTEDEIVNGTDLAAATLGINAVFQDTEQYKKIKAGDPVILSQQQKAFLKNAAYRAFEKHAGDAENGVAFVDQVRAAVRDGDEGQLASNEAVYVYGLLQYLDPSDQAQIIQKVGGTQVFLEGATIAEQNRIKQNQNYIDEFEKSIGVYTDQLANGNTLSDDLLDQLTTDLNVALSGITDESRRQEVATAMADLRGLNDFQKSFSKRVTLDTIDAAIADFKENGVTDRSLPGIDTDYESSVLSFMESYKEKMSKALSKNGDAIDYAARTKMDGIRIDPVDFSMEAFGSNETGLNARLQQGFKIRANNQLDHLPILTNAEMTELTNTFNQASFEQQRSIINGINQELGPKSSELFSKLSKDAPMMAHLAGLIELNGVSDEASRQIQLGLSAENKVKVSSLTNAGGSLSYNAIVLDAFGTLPEKLEQNLRGVTQKSVEAIVTYRAMYEGLDPAELDEDDLRSIVSFALGGTKDGERGGIGLYNGRSYFRPKNTSDDEFQAAVEGITAEKLARLPGNDIDEGDFGKVNELIEGVIASDETGIASVGRDSRGFIIYEMYRGEPGMAQAIGTPGGEPIQFTFEDLTTLARIETTIETEKQDARKEIANRSEQYLYRESTFFYDVLKNQLYDQNMQNIGLDRLDEIRSGGNRVR